MRDKVALLVNAHSRKAKRNPEYVPRLEKTFGDRGPFVVSRSVSELPEAMGDVIRSNAELVLISGGDGTLRQTLTHLIAAYGERPLPKVAILRGGTMNTVATSLNIHLSPVEQMKNVLQKYDEGIPLNFVRRPLLKVNQNLGFIFALGGFSKFIEHYQTHPHPTPLYAFGLVSHTVLSLIVNGSMATTFFEPFKVKATLDGRLWYDQVPVTNISASCIRHIGFHFKPYFGAEEKDDQFGVLVFKKLPKRLIFHLPKLFKGKQIKDRSIDQLPASELTLEVEHPMRPMMDGDILKAGQKFVVTSGPVLNLVTG